MGLSYIHRCGKLTANMQRDRVCNVVLCVYIEMEKRVKSKESHVKQRRVTCCLQKKSLQKFVFPDFGVFGLVKYLVGATSRRVAHGKLQNAIRIRHQPELLSNSIFREEISYFGFKFTVRFQILTSA